MLPPPGTWQICVALPPYSLLVQICVGFLKFKIPYQTRARICSRGHQLSASQAKVVSNCITLIAG
jgi:hypothetical protein